MHIPGRVGFQPKPKALPVPPFTRVETCGGISSQQILALGTAGCVAALVERLGQQVPPPRINYLPHVLSRGYAVEFSVCYGYAHDTYSVVSNELAVIHQLTAAFLAATSTATMTEPSSAYDWVTISKSFEFTMMGRITNTTAEEYAQPRTYPLHEAPSPAHLELSKLLVELRDLSVRVSVEAMQANAERIEQVKISVDQIKRQIWESQHPLQPVAPVVAPAVGQQVSLNF